MRGVLRLFPAWWRADYGEDFLEQFSDDTRTAKWVDLARTASGLRWRELQSRGDLQARGLVAGLGVVAGCDIALGVGMDERIGPGLVSHWWAAPFVAALAFSAATIALMLAAQLRCEPRRRRLLLICVAIITGAFTGSAAGAALARHGAELGAALGLVSAVIVTRLALRLPLDRRDTEIAVAVPLALLLGWRFAGSPVGPLLLIVITAALLVSRLDSRPPPSRESSS